MPWYLHGASVLWLIFYPLHMASSKENNILLCDGGSDDDDLISSLSVFIAYKGEASLASPWSLVWRQLRSLSLKALYTLTAPIERKNTSPSSLQQSSTKRSKRKETLLRLVVQASLSKPCTAPKPPSLNEAKILAARRSTRLEEQVETIGVSGWEGELSRVHADLLAILRGGEGWSFWLPFHPFNNIPSVHLPHCWTSETFFVADGGQRVKECGANVAMMSVPSLPTLSDVQSTAVITRRPIPSDVIPTFYFEISISEEGDNPNSLELGLALVRHHRHGRCDPSLCSTIGKAERPSTCRVVEAFVTLQASGFLQTAALSTEQQHPPPSPDEKPILLEQKDFGQPFCRGDIIGCGWNRSDHSIFFTRNGKVINEAPLSLPIPFHLSGAKEAQDGNCGCVYIHPLLRIRSRGAEMISNFGQFPFLFNLHAHLWHQCRLSSTSVDASSGPPLHAKVVWCGIKLPCRSSTGRSQAGAIPPLLVRDTVVIDQQVVLDHRDLGERFMPLASLVQSAQIPCRPCPPAFSRNSS